MQLIEVVEAVIKDHPFVDFNRKHKDGVVEHWSLCPCGYTTRHFKTLKSAHRDFKKHILEEINEELIERKLLVLNPEAKKEYSPQRIFA